jgi:DNA-binding PadR family transcriptional regulator
VPRGRPDGKHGYAVRRVLLERLGMTVPLPSIYRLIERLHQKEFVECREGTFADSYAGMPRKTFRLTDNGWRYLAERASSVRSQINRLVQSLSEYEKVVPHVEQRKAQSS